MYIFSEHQTTSSSTTTGYILQRFHEVPWGGLLNFLGHSPYEYKVNLAWISDEVNRLPWRLRTTGLARKTKASPSCLCVDFLSCCVHSPLELGLGLIQTQMTQKPMLRAEVYAHAFFTLPTAVPCTYRDQGKRGFSLRLLVIRFAILNLFGRLPHNKSPFPTCPY